MEVINRKIYFDTLLRLRDKQIIKVISGVRRCGKSTLLESYRDHLLAQGVEDERIIFINFEDLAFGHLRDYRALHEYINAMLRTGKMNYIMLDEIQHVEGYEKAVDSLYIKKNVDLYITGSNAYFLSGELATLLTGRYTEIKMLPLSFAEYCEAKGVAALDGIVTLQDCYRRYLLNSSFPYTLQIDDASKDVSDYLQGLFNSILLKDVVARKRITDVLMLESVIKFLFDNVGSVLSSTGIANTMTSSGRKIDQRTVEKYLDALRECFLFYESKRYNVKGKRILATLEKYYAVDIGLRFMLIGGEGLNVGHILENIVYLELLRRGYEVYVGQIGQTEVDFIATSSGKRLYIQVAATVRGETVLRRELRPLQAIADSHPKMILTLDDDPEGNFDGIVSKNALLWLLE